jgi:hypothetical protein
MTKSNEIEPKDVEESEVKRRHAVLDEVVSESEAMGLYAGDQLERQDQLAWQYKDYKAAIVEKWWRKDESYRDDIAALSAGAARTAPNPEAAYTLWLSWAQTPEERAYMDDLITRVSHHLHQGTGAHPPPVTAFTEADVAGLDDLDEGVPSGDEVDGDEFEVP